jgi:hypothetical protein
MYPACVGVRSKVLEANGVFWRWHCGVWRNDVFSGECDESRRNFGGLLGKGFREDFAAMTEPEEVPFQKKVKVSTNGARKGLERN